MKTSEEKQLEKISQLKAKLQREQNKLNQNRRKERNGQLIALGILMEQIYKSANEAGKDRIKNSAKEHLNDRNLKRCLEAFMRLDSDSQKTLKNEIENNENSNHI